MPIAWATGEVRTALALALALVLVAACGGKARPADAPLVVADGAAVGPAGDVEGEEGGAAADATCVAECGERYPGAAQREGYPEYCGELCTSPSEPSAQCVASCEKSHEPGARYDDRGEYVAGEDTRDEAQRQADRAGCEQECAKVPVVSEDGMAACVGACTADGRNESACQAECDPDPYDQCRYAPCD
jgi:hypothetical protein